MWVPPNSGGLASGMTPGVGGDRMAITNTFRWNGKLGSDWRATDAGPPPKSNWDLIDGTAGPGSIPEGLGDVAVFDGTGSDGTSVTVTTNNATGDAEELQVVAATSVTFSSGHYGFGIDGQSGMIIDENAAVIVASSGTLANRGSFDAIGLTTGGSLEVQSGAGFDDLGMIVGIDEGSSGTVTVDAAFGFEVAQSAPGAADGVLIIGDSGDGSVDISDTPAFFSATAILGQNAGSTGNLSLSNSIWGGSDLTVGQSGTGNATIEAGSTVALLNVVVGAVDGSDSIDISGGSQFGSDFAILGEAAAATGDVTLNDSTWNGATLTVGLDGTGNATIDAGSTVSFADLIIGQNGPEGTGSIDVSGSSTLMTATAILGEAAGATGSVTLNESTWFGTSLTVGQGGTGNATIETGSTLQFSDIVIGPDGELDATGAAGSPGTVIATTFTLEFGTLDVTGGGEVLVGASSGTVGAVSVDGTSSPLVGLGTLHGNVVLGNQGTVEATQPIPGALLIDGNIHGTGTIEPLMTLEVQGGIDAGVDIAFSASIGAQVGDLVLDVAAANLGTIVGFGAGNTIDVQGSRFTDAVFTQGISGAAGRLTLSGTGFTPLSLAVAGKYSVDSFVATPGASDTVVTLCFAAGTRIATPRGEVLVEQLAVGDEVLTLGGAARPIMWIGTGRVLATRGRRNAATPVIVRRGALADNVPHRDLRVTKGHSLFLNGVLIPVEHLINHRTIVWDDRAQQVAIYHVELETHDVLMADGAPAESYRDDGNRWLFRNANSAWHLPPQEPCVPVLTGGPIVDSVWQRLANRARPRLDVRLTNEPDLHLLVDGRRVDAVSRDDARYVFRLATRPRHMRIRSRSGVPQELGLVRDPRELGVALCRVAVAEKTRKCVMQAHDMRLADGFHDFEVEHSLRWTNGNAAVPTAMFVGLIAPLTVVLYVGATACYLDEGSELRVA